MVVPTHLTGVTDSKLIDDRLIDKQIGDRQIDRQIDQNPDSVYFKTPAKQ